MYYHANFMSIETFLKQKKDIEELWTEVREKWN